MRIQSRQLPVLTTARSSSSKGISNRSLLATAIGLALASAGAQADTPPRQPVPQALPKVSVESTTTEPRSPKYTQPLADTPRAVTVIDESVLRDTAATSLVDALRTVPGITMAMGEGGQPFSDRPFIRGFESSTGTLVDGLRDTGAQSRDVFNLEQIEVAKGPSGAFAGRGAPGGSINLVTKQAQFDDFSSATARAGNANQRRATADINRALGDSLALRMNVMWQEQDIPGRDAVFDDRWGVAPSLAWQPGERTLVNLGYTHYESDGLIDYGHPLDQVTGRPVSGIDPDNFYGLVVRDFHETEQDAGTLELSHGLTDNLTLRNVTRYSYSTNDYVASNPDDSQGNVVNGLVVRNVKSNSSRNGTLVNQTDLTALFNTGGVRHSLATGLEYGHERTDRATYAVEQLAPGGVEIPRGGCDQFGAGAPSGYNCTSLTNPNPFDPWTGSIMRNASTITEADTRAAYVFDTLTLNDRWLLNLGLRWDDFSTTTSTGLRNDSDFFSHQAGVVYRPVRTGRFYLSYGTAASPSGSTVGDGGDNLGATGQDLQPERSVNYELGTKWELFGQQLALNAALFRTETRDAHVSIEPGRGGAQQAIGKQRVDGIEVSASGFITPAWRVFAGYSVLDSEIIDAGPINVADVGNELPNAPAHSGSLWTSYALTGQASVGLGANYMSKRYGNTANTRSVAGYWRFDLMAAYEVMSNVNLQLNVQNLADERYYERVYTTHMATMAPGRSISLSASIAF